LTVAAFPTAKLADCVDLLAGYAFKSQHFTDKSDDIALVKGENVSQGCILWEISKRWSVADWPKLEKFQLRSGDVVVAMDRPWVPAGLKWAYIRIDDPKALLVQRCCRLRSSTPRLDQDFLRFVIGGPGFESYVIPITTGVNVPHISGKQILDYEFTLPPLPVQQRIAGILSAYDELIENSQRRIKILEATARALYREWFVHFRFPGHENHPHIASHLGEIPRGWEVKKLGEIISAHIGGGWGKDVPDQDHTEPAWVIRGTDIPEARYSQVGGVPHRIHTASNLRSRRLVAGDIVFEVSGGSKGQPVGRALLITPELLAGLDGDVICASFCKRIQPDISGYGSELLYLSFLEDYESGEIEQYQVQSTGISNFKWTDYIANSDRVVPPDALRSEFRGYVGPLFTQVATLGRKIQNLRRTRNLLLPRLLTGQIDLGMADEVVAEAREPLNSTKPVQAARPTGLERTGVPRTAAQVRPGPHAEQVPVASPRLDDIAREEVMVAIRRVFSEGGSREREDALREVAHTLGFKRLGARVETLISNEFSTAVRRGILVKDEAGYRLGFRSYTECTRDSLKNDFESAMGRDWISREEAIRAFARWSGFARVGEVIDETARSLINGLIREGRIEADGTEFIRRTKAD
jgi:type I restriction enzyme, S subunit